LIKQLTERKNIVKIQNNFCIQVLLTLLILAVSAMLFTPDLKAEEVNVAALDSTANGIVARYVISAATSEGNLNAINCEGFKYAAVQIVGPTPSFTTNGAAGATFKLMGTAFPNDYYMAQIPTTISGATTTINAFGVVNVELGGLNYFQVNFNDNAAEKHVVVSLKR
jgi:hypothetical protein